mmetsp:Transcript_9399/g.22416  ORF Transcript_9399/g.22416 Transcript_9399/m.22416 type:complete len:257 (+) Transcript_9399:940-1710(+)
MQRMPGARCQETKQRLGLCSTQLDVETVQGRCELIHRQNAVAVEVEAFEGCGHDNAELCQGQLMVRATEGQQKIAGAHSEGLTAQRFLPALGQHRVQLLCITSVKADLIPAIQLLHCFLHCCKACVALRRTWQAVVKPGQFGNAGNFRHINPLAGRGCRRGNIDIVVWMACCFAAVSGKGGKQCRAGRHLWQCVHTLHPTAISGEVVGRLFGLLAEEGFRLSLQEHQAWLRHWHRRCRCRAGIRPRGTQALSNSAW